MIQARKSRMCAVLIIGFLVQHFLLDSSGQHIL